MDVLATTPEWRARWFDKWSVPGLVLTASQGVEGYQALVNVASKVAQNGTEEEKDALVEVLTQVNFADPAASEIDSDAMSVLVTAATQYAPDQLGALAQFAARGNGDFGWYFGGEICRDCLAVSVYAFGCGASGTGV